jgi:transcriptional regulator with XRE-family HTH domain
MSDARAIDIQIGRRLAVARKAAGLTVRDLAARLGWPYTTLANYEEGRRPLRVAQLVAIAAALGQSPAAFLVDTPEAAAVVNRIDGDLDRCLQLAFILDSLDSMEESEAPAVDDQNDGTHTGSS